MLVAAALAVLTLSTLQINRRANDIAHRQAIEQRDQCRTTVALNLFLHALSLSAPMSTKPAVQRDLAIAERLTDAPDPPGKPAPLPACARGK